MNPHNNITTSHGFFSHNCQLDNAKTELLEMLRTIQPAFSRPSKTLQRIFDLANGRPLNLSLHDRLRNIQYLASYDLPFVSSREQQVLGVLSTYKPNHYDSIKTIVAGLEQAKKVQESRFGNVSHFVKTLLGC